MNINAIKFNTNPVITKIQNKTQNTNQPIKNQNNLETPNGYYNKLITNISFKRNANSKPNLKERFEGCLIGGAVGDALGAKIEAWSYDSIKKVFGQKGLRSLLVKKDGIANITDDTQMTLFTTHALIRNKLVNKGIINQISCIEDFKKAYVDWHKTQEEIPVEATENNLLLRDERMYSKRFPGKTCLETTSSLEEMGSIDKPINNSKGNGAIMRSAPIGLALANSPDKAFDLAMNAGALTHGNPKGYISAGAFAYLIANIVNGKELNDAITLMQNKLLETNEEGKEISSLIDKAISLSKLDIDDNEAIQQLGLGFLADEALAISIYSSLKHQDNFRLGVISAINHSGDSDTTGAITGNILGSYLGINSIPNKFKSKIELENTIKHLSNDLFESITNIEEPEKNYGESPVFATSYDRRATDDFSCTTSNQRFTEKEINELNNLSTEDAIKRRRELIEKYLGLRTNSTSN